MHAAGRRCPDRPAVSYQTRRGNLGNYPWPLALDVERAPSLQHFQQRERKHSCTSTYPFTHRNHHDQRNTMTNAIIESIVSRSTTKYYDPAVTLSDDLQLL